jgi:hypothetical protein
MYNDACKNKNHVLIHKSKLQLLIDPLSRNTQRLSLKNNAEQYAPEKKGMYYIHDVLSKFLLSVMLLNRR